MRKTSWAGLFLVCAAAIATLAAAPAPQGSGYHMLKKVVLGGDGGWDYLSADPVSHRLFISRGTHIMVVDADGKVVGMNIESSSGDIALDRAAWGSLTASSPFPPLPSEFHGPYLELLCRFYYNPTTGEMEREQ